jgi:hypothetical protein
VPRSAYLSPSRCVARQHSVVILICQQIINTGFETGHTVTLKGSGRAQGERRAPQKLNSSSHRHGAIVDPQFGWSKRADAQRRSLERGLGGRAERSVALSILSLLPSPAAPAAASRTYSVLIIITPTLHSLLPMSQSSILYK